MSKYFLAAFQICFILSIQKAFAITYDENLWQELRSPSEIIVQFYPVDGVNFEEIKNKLNNIGPSSVTGGKHYAEAKWFLSWKWPFADHKAEYSKSQVEATVRITLPLMQNDNLGNTTAWKKMFEAMVKHELKHAEHAFAAKSQIEEEIRKFDPALKPEEANLLINKVIITARRKDISYDLATNHGKAEGILIPQSESK
jgi:predicted secreted Zn-dependent protease